MDRRAHAAPPATAAHCQLHGHTLDCSDAEHPWLIQNKFAGFFK
jgi:hypothetical protein